MSPLARIRCWKAAVLWSAQILATSCVKVPLDARSSIEQRRSLNLALCKQKLNASQGREFGLNFDALGSGAQTFVCEDRLSPYGGVLYISKLLTAEEAAKLARQEVAKLQQHHHDTKDFGSRMYLSQVQRIDTEQPVDARKGHWGLRRQLGSASLLQRNQQGRMLRDASNRTSAKEAVRLSTSELETSQADRLRVAYTRRWGQMLSSGASDTSDKVKEDGNLVWDQFGKRLRELTGLAEPHGVQIAYTFEGAPVQPFHHDRNGAKNRYLTVLTYLQAPQAGGGTVFPTVGELDLFAQKVQTWMPKYGAKFDTAEPKLFGDGDPVRIAKSACAELAEAEKQHHPSTRFGILPVPGDAVIFFHFNRKQGISETQARASPTRHLIPEWNHFHAGCDLPQAAASETDAYDPLRAKIAAQFFAEVQQS